MLLLTAILYILIISKFLTIHKNKKNKIFYVFNISDIHLLFKIRILLVKNFLNLFFDLSHIFQISSYHDMIQTIFTQKKYYCMLLL